MHSSIADSPHPTNGFQQDPNVAEAKRAVRAQVRHDRTRLPAASRAALNSLIQARLLSHLSTLKRTEAHSNNTPSPTVAAFVPTAQEPGGRSLPDLLRAAGCRVVLPRVHGKELEWVYYNGQLALSDWGLLEPTGEATSQPLLTMVDVIILPALSIDFEGHRLGQGGGFYDRELAKANTNVRRWALVDHQEFREHVPHAPHDLIVNTVITEHGVFVI